MTIPQMAERRDGVVIIVSNIAALKGSTVPGVHGMSKAADTALVRNYACEWGASNIRTNAILPGLIKADFARAPWENDKLRKARDANISLRHLGEAAEIGGIAAFLGSKAASFIIGQTIVAVGVVTIA